MVFVPRPEQRLSLFPVRLRCIWQGSFSLLSWSKSEMHLVAAITPPSFTVSTRSRNPSLEILISRHASIDYGECWKPLSQHLFVWKGLQLQESDVDNLDQQLALPTSYHTLASIAEIKLLS